MRKCWGGIQVEGRVGKRTPWGTCPLQTLMWWMFFPVTPFSFCALLFPSFPIPFFSFLSFLFLSLSFPSLPLLYLTLPSLPWLFLSPILPTLSFLFLFLSFSSVPLPSLAFHPIQSIPFTLFFLSSLQFSSTPFPSYCFPSLSFSSLPSSSFTFPSLHPHVLSPVALQTYFQTVYLPFTSKQTGNNEENIVALPHFSSGVQCYLLCCIYLHFWKPLCTVSMVYLCPAFWVPVWLLEI